MLVLDNAHTMFSTDLICIYGTTTYVLDSPALPPIFWSHAVPPPKTVPEFCALIEKSGLLGENGVNLALEEMNETGIPADLENFIANLITMGQLTVFQSLKLLDGCWKGFFVGRCKIQSLLRKRGHFLDHLALLGKTREKVTLSIALRQVLSDHRVRNMEEFRTRFRKFPALGFSSPHEIEFEGELLYLARPYRPSVSVEEIVFSQGPLSIATACEVIRQAAKRLAYIHECGLWHQSLQPRCLMVTENAQPRDEAVEIHELLAQFFHRPYPEPCFSTASQEAMASPPISQVDFISPEQTLDSALYDQRSDIYSLGVIFYWMLSCQVPCLGDTVAQKLLAKYRSNQPLSHVMENVPARLEDIVHQMLMPRREDRFDSMEEVVCALQPFAGELVIDFNAAREFQFKVLVRQAI